MIFKEKIINLRKIRGLSQTDLACAVGVSRQSVYKWETGQSYPEAAKLLELKNFFNISIDDLLDDNFDIVIPEKKKRKRLPKEVKIEIENKVEEELTVTEDAPEELKEEVMVGADVSVASEIAAPPVEEPTILKESSDKEKTEEKAEPEKKRGFFDRLFGRK